MRRLSCFLLGLTPRHLCQMMTSPPPLSRIRFLFSKTIFGVDKSYHRHYSDLLNFNSLRDKSNQLLHCAHFSGLRNKEVENQNHQRQVEVEIMSKEFIKPAIPTPQHLRIHEVSLFDQLFPNVYLPFVYFYSNDDQQKQNSTLKKRQILKESLSKTLTKFYPLAGRFMGRCHIDCNDDGVYYVEAKVKDHLFDFLKLPDNKSIHELLPLHPNVVHSVSENRLAMVQVTEFGCGGIAIATYTSHKLMDGYSNATFLKAWSATARTLSKEIISPSFISSLLFPSNPALPQDATSLVFPLFAKSKSATRRFLFPASSLAILKDKLNSSRVLAVTGLIWKCAIAASKVQSKAIYKNCTLQLSLTTILNIRERISPPLPPYALGNIFWITPPVQCREDEDLDANTCVQRVKDSISRVNNSDYIGQRLGYWLSHTEIALGMMHLPYADKNAKHMLITSLCNTGTYEADFGWGKPLWVCAGYGDSNFPLTENFVLLMDTKCGNGIEAWVTLHEEDMNAMEQDPELLTFSSLNASPLPIF